MPVVVHKPRPVIAEAEEPFYPFSNRLSTVAEVVVLMVAIVAGSVWIPSGTAVVTWH